MEHFTLSAAARRGSEGAELATRSETNYLKKGDRYSDYLALFDGVGAATVGLAQKGLWAIEWPLLPWKVRAFLGAKRRRVRAVLVVRNEGPRRRSAKKKFG